MSVGGYGIWLTPPGAVPSCGSQGVSSLMRSSAKLQHGSQFLSFRRLKIISWSPHAPSALPACLLVDTGLLLPFGCVHAAAPGFSVQAGWSLCSQFCEGICPEVELLENTVILLDKPGGLAYSLSTFACFLYLRTCSWNLGGNQQHLG